MRLSDLPEKLVARIRRCDFDQIMEKHEGPENWSYFVNHHDPEILTVDTYNVLLPLYPEQYANITFLRCIPSDDGRVLTIFLQDKTYNDDPRMEKFWTGRLAICEKMLGSDLYIATVYHEWFIVENEVLQEQSP
ncbi:hypothetical protein KFU94_54050 [Chloroflexi bacterium TSY]|nr:hypothetical protein [Chloroflexi bacterium TSY]